MWSGQRPLGRDALLEVRSQCGGTMRAGTWSVFLSFRNNPLSTGYEFMESASWSMLFHTAIFLRLCLLPAVNMVSLEVSLLWFSKRSFVEEEGEIELVPCLQDNVTEPQCSEVMPWTSVPTS